MAKKKSKKRNIKKTLKIELLGLLFIFLAIFGSGASLISDGAIPATLEHAFRFFLGIWYFVAAVLLLVTGIILLVKRRYPNFLNKKLIGFYIGFLGLLLLTHIQTFERLLVTETDISIMKTTWDNFLMFVKGEGSSTKIGGGMIGAILFVFSYYLFSSIGSKIVSVFFILIGFIFMTDFSVGDFFIKLGRKFSEQYTKYRQQFIDYRNRKKIIIDDEDTKNEKPLPELINPERTDEEFTQIAYAFPEDNEEVEEEQDNNSKQSKTVADSDNLTNHDEENLNYQLPSIDLLNKPIKNSQQHENSKIHSTIKTLDATFKNFKVNAKVTKVNVGPAVTKYEISPDPGVKVSRIVGLHDDLALALAAKDIRIEAPIPGKSAVGIEVPNSEVATVSLKEVVEHTLTHPSKLLFSLGRDISDNSVVGELNKMPHLLVAGATGSGKSVCINGIIATILMRAKPHEVKMMMIDPKKVELNMYNGIPHLLAPVVTDPKKASMALRKVVAEMDRRYELFSETGTRNIEAYNELTTKEEPNIPYIVVLVDELADLMMVASSDVEDSITRLAQMARAAGIHLIIATQRPSVDVITGVIKANIPSRIAFSVSSQTDSRTILDTGGAEKLLGRGDMLYMPVGISKPIRVQGAFLSDEEVERIVSHCISQQQASYQEDMIPDDETTVNEEVEDVLFDDAVKHIMNRETASVSMLQRKFKIGYNRAARLIDAMEDRGMVGPFQGNKPREVYIHEEVDDQPS